MQFYSPNGSIFSIPMSCEFTQKSLEYCNKKQRNAPLHSSKAIEDWALQTFFINHSSLTFFFSPQKKNKILQGFLCAFGLPTNKQILNWRQKPGEWGDTPSKRKTRQWMSECVETKRMKRRTALAYSWNLPIFLPGLLHPGISGLPGIPENDGEKQREGQREWGGCKFRVIRKKTGFTGFSVSPLISF